MYANFINVLQEIKLLRFSEVYTLKVQLLSGCYTCEIFQVIKISWSAGMTFMPWLIVVIDVGMMFFSLLTFKLFFSSDCTTHNW